MEGGEKSKALRMTIIGVLISVLTIAVIMKYTETRLTLSEIERANVLYIALAVAFQIAFWILWALRLKMVVSYLGHRISMKYSLETTIASMFLAAITPSSAGGEPLRVKMLKDNGMSVGSAAASVLTERILDSIFFATALPVFIFISRFAVKFGFEVSAIFTIALILFLLFIYFIVKNKENVDRFASRLNSFLNRFSERAEEIATRVKNELISFREALIKLSSSPLNALYLLTLTAVMWSVGFMIPSAILMAFNYDPCLLLSYTAQLIIVIVSLIPLTPGSSGIAEVSMAYLYSKFVPQDILGPLVGIWRFITYFLNIIVGFFVNLKIFRRVYVDV